MPIYNIEDRLKLRRLGLNPDQFEELEEAPAPEQQSPPNKPTGNVVGVGAGFRQFLRESPALAAGLYTGANVGEAGTILGGPLVGVPAGLIAGIATSALAKYGQNAIINQTPFAEAYKQSEQQDIAEHPIATTIGGIAAGLPFLRPSLQPLRELASGTIGPAAKNALIGGAAQGGLYAGQEAYNQGTLTPDLDLAQLGINVAGGAALNKPTGLGKSIGLHEVVTPKEAAKTAEEKAAEDRINQGVKDAVQAEIEKQAKNVEEQARIAEDAKKKAAEANAIEQQRLAEEQARITAKEELRKEENRKWVEEQNRKLEEADKINEEKVKTGEITSEQRQKDFELAKAEIEAERQKRLEQFGKNIEAGVAKQEVRNMAEGAQEAIVKGKELTVKNPVEVGPKFEDKIPTETTDRTLPTAEEKPLTPAEELQAKFDEGKPPTNYAAVHKDLTETPGEYPDVHKLQTAADKVMAKSAPVPVHGMNTERMPIPETAFGIKPGGGTIGKVLRQAHNLIKSDIDKVRETISKPLGDAFHNFFDTYTRHYGALVNKFSNRVRQVTNLDNALKAILQNPKDYLTQNSQEMRNVLKYFRAKQDGLTAPKLSANEDKIRQAVQDIMSQVDSMQSARKTMNTPAARSPDYFPNMIDPRVIREVNQNPLSAKSQQLKKEFIDYQIKNGHAATTAEAQKLLDRVKQGYNNPQADIAKSFGHLDEAQGYKIPESWQNPNLLDSMSRFLNRAARRFAFEDTLRPAPIQQELKTHGTNDIVKSVYGDIGGKKYYDNPLLNNLMGAIRSVRLGPLTGAKDLVSGIFLGLQHHEGPLQQVKNIVGAWKNMKQNILDAYETGRIRQHMNSLEVDNGMDDIVHWLKRFRDIASDTSGRNFFDKMIRATSFGDGRLTTLDFLSQVGKGKMTKQAQDWFKNFGEGTNWKSGKLTPEELKTIAARYVDSVQGTYDRRGLNSHALEGWMSPYLSLSRWNIEKANNFIKYTVKPLQEGNPKPFLMSTIGIVAGGAVVNKMMEVLTGRKRKEATYAEIAEAPNKLMPSFYKAAGLASAAGHIGIIGDLFKGMLDMSYAGNRPQAINNVLLDAAENTATVAANWAHSVIENGYDPDTMQEAISQILMDNFQAYRLGMAYMNADTQRDIDRANKFRDLRTFNLLNDNGVSDLTTDFKVSLDDVKMRQYKRTESLEEARQILPDLIKQALEKSQGDPEKLKKELVKIKQNSYQTAPNPSTMPNTFLRYINFLKNTQGEEAARDRLLDYVRQNELNTAKEEGL